MRRATLVAASTSAMSAGGASAARRDAAGSSNASTGAFPASRSRSRRMAAGALEGLMPPMFALVRTQRPAADDRAPTAARSWPRVSREDHTAIRVSTDAAAT